MKSRHFAHDSLVPISKPLGGKNPLRELNNKEFEQSLDEWRTQNKMLADPTAKIWTMMYLNEAERRWRP